MLKSQIEDIIKSIPYPFDFILLLLLIAGFAGFVYGIVNLIKNIRR